MVEALPDYMTRQYIDSSEDEQDNAPRFLPGPGHEMVAPALKKSDSDLRLEYLWKKTTANKRRTRKDILDRSNAQKDEIKHQQVDIGEKIEEIHEEIEEHRKIQNDEILQMVLQRKKTQSPVSEEVRSAVAKMPLIKIKFEKVKYYAQ